MVCVQSVWTDRGDPRLLRLTAGRIAPTPGARWVRLCRPRLSAHAHRRGRLMQESRRILLDGVIVEVRRDGNGLLAPDGRRIGLDEAEHLPPVEPTKIICV